MENEPPPSPFIKTIGCLQHDHPNKPTLLWRSTQKMLLASSGATKETTEQHQECIGSLYKYVNLRKLHKPS